MVKLEQVFLFYHYCLWNCIEDISAVVVILVINMHCNEVEPSAILRVLGF
jgi:hypothetical protein